MHITHTTIVRAPVLLALHLIPLHSYGSKRETSQKKAKADSQALHGWTRTMTMPAAVDVLIDPLLLTGAAGPGSNGCVPVNRAWCSH